MGETKRIVHHEAAKKDTINIMASGLTSDEASQVEAFVRQMARKRSHGKHPELLYDMVFNGQ